MQKTSSKKSASPKKAPKTAIKAKPAVSPKLPVKAAAPQPTGNYFYANGKRKTSVAGVRLYTEGKGTVTINDRTFENYFPVSTDRDKVISPLRMTGTMKMFTILAHVHGGGIHSQAEAVRHAIAKALLHYNAELRGTIKPVGFLTRDSRVKERKKYGLKRARRAPQFSKR